MAIKKIKIPNFTIFKNFSLEPCPGINVLVGENGAGKTALMREVFNGLKSVGSTVINLDCGITDAHAVFIPEGYVLEQPKELISCTEKKQASIKDLTSLQESIIRKIAAVIDGKVVFDEADDAFCIDKSDGTRIPFAYESSGYKKFGYLGLLISIGQLAPNSVLFWDEPENSISPKIIPSLADIFLELSYGGVQIFIATHSYMIAKYLDLRKKSNSDLLFVSMQKNNGVVNIAVSESYNDLQPNPIENAEEHLYQEVVNKVVEDKGWQV